MIRSNPPGAQVFIDGMTVGSTPFLANLRRKIRHEIKILREGYLEEARVTRRGFNWWFVGNLIFGGPIGIITDLATGSQVEDPGSGLEP